MIPSPLRGAGRVVVALLCACFAASCSDAGPPPARDGGPRIASLVPTATEILFAIGAGDLLLARSRFCDHPAAARDLPVAGDATSVAVEPLLALRADLVLVGAGGQHRALDPLRSESFRVETVLAETVGDLRRTILRLGELTGRTAAAAELAASLDAALELARANRPRGRPPRVAFVVQREPLIVAGGGSYAGELLAAVGAVNIAGDLDRAWPALSEEAFLARDPEVILEAEFEPGATGEDFRERYRGVTAHATGRIHRVTAPSLVRPGPRLPEALAVLAELVHGGAR